MHHAPKNLKGEKVALGVGAHFLAHGEVLPSVRVVSMCDWARWEGCFEGYLGLQTVVAREVQSGTAAHGPDLEQGPDSSGAVEQHWDVEQTMVAQMIHCEPSCLRSRPNE